MKKLKQVNPIVTWIINPPKNSKSDLFWELRKFDKLTGTFKHYGLFDTYLQAVYASQKAGNGPIDVAIKNH